MKNTPSAVTFPVFVTLSTPVGDLHLALPDDSWAKNDLHELLCVHSGLECFTSDSGASLLQLVAAVLEDLGCTAAVLARPEEFPIGGYRPPALSRSYGLPDLAVNP